MNIDEWENLMDKCRIMVNDDGFMEFHPYSYTAKKVADKIIKNNHLENLSMADFQKISDEFRPLYMARRKIKQKKAKQFSQMSTQQIANLPMEKKIEYMEILFPMSQNVEELVEVCKKNGDNIRACLFNMDFPQSFWNEEKKSAQRYAALITNQPKITDKLKNWQQISLEDKKTVIEKAGKIFEFVYGIKPEIIYFTPEEERAQNRAQGLPEDTHINAAYQKGGKIYFNEERLQDSDNFFAISVLFHEGTHLRQHFKTFKDPLVERIFNCAMSNVTVYENMVNDKKSSDYKDLYTMQPCEVHAHGLQEYVEQQITEKTGIRKTQHTPLNNEILTVHNKGFSMAKLAQYRSSQK